MVSGNRVSAEAIKRNRDASRERARLRRARLSAEDHSLELKQRREYEHANRDHINTTRKLRYGAGMELAERPFICWDGEGYDNEEGKHCYMLFGCSHDIDAPIVGRDLGTVECLDYLLEIESRYPKSFHVGFAFDYDVNMILRDLESRHLRHLADYGMVHWGRYRIAYIKGKRFTVSKGNPRRGEKRLSVTVYDAFGFFQSKYTTSLIKFNVATEEEIRLIVEGKAKRGNFTWEDLKYVKKYWQDEIGYMPVLMNKLRDMCFDAGFFVRQWHGPGVLAADILKRRDVKKLHSQNVPVEAQIASRYSYAGGRFQFWKFGLYTQRIYTADINSAYIYACSLLPDLSNGQWRRVIGRNIDRTKLAQFGMYRIRYHARRQSPFQGCYPLFHRDKHGNLCWPYRTEGWYWTPEAELLATNSDAEFLEAWIYDGDGSKPFSWVDSEFDKRLQLQTAGNPAEKTIKWALAAVYGAFARRVGWDRKKHCAPRSHELMWAGFITSWCRAEVYKIGYECYIRGGLVSIDTDGITSTVPIQAEWLERGQGKKLGQWKLEEFAGILYCQSGFYWLMDDDGEWSTVKTRGITRGSVDVSVGLRAWKTDWIIRQEITKFFGFREALKMKDGMRVWRTWGSISHDSKFGGRNTRDGTSFHWPAFCDACKNGSDNMHVTCHKQPSKLLSEPHKLPWLDDELDERERDLIVRVEDEIDNM
jgi:DNA polymerase type B, organellar and viral